MHNDPANCVDLWGLESFGEDPDHYLYLQVNGTPESRIQNAMKKYQNEKYVIADIEKGIQEFRCDNYVQAVLEDAGFNSSAFMAGDATQKSVQDHIDNAIQQGKTSRIDVNNAPDLRSGAYVVYMSDSDEGLAPHSAIIIVDKNGGVSYTDNSSNNSTGGVKTRSFEDTQAMQTWYDGYSSFYYQKVDCSASNY